MPYAGTAAKLLRSRDPGTGSGSKRRNEWDLETHDPTATAFARLHVESQWHIVAATNYRHLAYAESPYEALGAIDPYVDWALGPGERPFLPVPQRPANKLMPVLVQLEGETAKQFQEGFSARTGSNASGAGPFSNVLHTGPAGDGCCSRFWLRPWRTREFATASEIRLARYFVDRVSLGRPFGAASAGRCPSLPAAGAPRRWPKPPGRGGGRGRGPAADRRQASSTTASLSPRGFRGFAGWRKSRVEFWWLQDGVGPVFRRPRLWTTARDRSMLDACRTGAVDEDVLLPPRRSVISSAPAGTSPRRGEPRTAPM